MTFIEALNNPLTHDLIEQIEELTDKSDSESIAICDQLIKELATHGYKMEK